MIAAEPAIDEVSAAVYVIPTDAPEARLPGLPLARQLGRIRDDVPVYGSGGFTSYDEQQTREQLTGWVERDRDPRVKIKIGEAWGTNVRRDLERVALAREIIGQDTELYVDANGAYTTGQAVRVGHQLADFGVSWFEEPVSSDDLAGLAAVRKAGAVDCLQLDVTRCGGISEFLRGAALAAGHSMQVSAHCAPNLHAPEYFHDHQRTEQLMFDGALDPHGGTLAPDPALPGLGLELRTTDAAHYRRA